MEQNELNKEQPIIHKQSLLPILGTIFLGAIFLTVGFFLSQNETDGAVACFVLGGIFFALGLLGLFTRKSTKSDEERLEAIKRSPIFIVLLYLALAFVGFIIPIVVIVYVFMQPNSNIVEKGMVILVGGAFLIAGIKGFLLIRSGDF